MRGIPWGCATFPFWCEAFGGIRLCFWWRTPFLQINGVPIPVERSWIFFLTRMFHICKWCDWKDSHMFESWCKFQKMQLIEFWLVKQFHETNGAPSKQMAAGFRWKERSTFFKTWCYFHPQRAAELLWARCCIFKGHRLYFDTIAFLLFKAKLFKSAHRFGGEGVLIGGHELH